MRIIDKDQPRRISATCGSYASNTAGRFVVYQDDHLDCGIKYNVAPFLMEGFGLMKSFRGIIQNQLLFEGFGIMKSFRDRNKKIADSES